MWLTIVKKSESHIFLVTKYLCFRDQKNWILKFIMVEVIAMEFFFYFNFNFYFNLIDVENNVKMCCTVLMYEKK